MRTLEELEQELQKMEKLEKENEEILNRTGEDKPVKQLKRKTVLQAVNFDREHALALAGLYVSTQKVRVGAGNRVDAHNRKTDNLADPGLIQAIKEELHKVELQAARGLKAYATASPLGRWAMSQRGCSYIIAAQLLAHIDVAFARTAGCIWSFAGLDPSKKWEKGEKRPYNARLKTLCWQLGSSFKRVSAHKDAFYGHIYRQRKTQEVRYNEEGRFKDQALQKLADSKGRRTSPEQRQCWASGKLQPAGLDLRAMRYAVRIFLSHYHAVGRQLLGLPVPKPWVLEHGGHVHEIGIPNWPMKE